MMLADLRAGVIKVERADGDGSRRWVPPFVGGEDTAVATYLLFCSRNKESVMGDLKSDEGRRTREALVRFLEAGLASITGLRGEPTKVGGPSADLLTGMKGAFSTVAARSQGLLVEVDDPVLSHTHPPRLGEHNESLHAWLSAGASRRP
jgi:crotonobetainyl-CoA:carnitine CoA-transferase CaiB-like acyl-CoA transferase